MKVVSVKQISKYQINIYFDKEILMLFGIKENIVRSVYTDTDKALQSQLDIECKCEAKLTVEERKNQIHIKSREIAVIVDKNSGKAEWKNLINGEIVLREAGKELRKVPLITYSTGDEKPIIKTVKTVDGERNFVENLRPIENGEIYKGKLKFDFKEGESIHGLGQGEEGIYNYRGHVQYLYQHNMRIPIPFMLSSRGYAILFDATCLMTFNDDERGSYVYLDAIEQLDYYIIVSENIDELVNGYRVLTGKAAMLPKYAFGYVQSKEAYRNQDEILEIAKEYRKRKIPIDLIVQDWNTWEKGKWGNKKVDKNRYPSLAKMNQALHDINIHSMVSIWPNMNAGTENHEEMSERGFLLNDFCTYNAFDEDARNLYWKQANEELFSGGFDAWWCDSTEPFSGPDWNGAYLREPWERFTLVGDEHKKFLGVKMANYYATMHARGIYENQRKENSSKRVLNLTRSGYASIQKYGAVLWSGDITATWLSFKKQIVEGLNMAMSGIPYWTLDIGGFFTVNQNWQNRGCGCDKDSDEKWFWRGDYETGTDDLGYRELYIRWFEYGAFLPMFRSHGTDTPREVWRFGEKGELFYDVLVDAINNRYRLMPYIYSLAAGVYFDNDTMMRSLLFDYKDDKRANAVSTQFMLGRSLMVCPVTEPMYYGKESTKLNSEKVWECYLPANTDWICYYSGRKYQGGQYITVDAPLGRMPLFVKSGSIIPMEHSISYADEEAVTPLEIHIYPGRDSKFQYYEDEGDGYGYEKGEYNRIKMEWRDERKTFHMGGAYNSRIQKIVGRKCVLICGDKQKEFIYQGVDIELCL